MTQNWLDFERYAVLGLGRSGKAAANLLARHGKSVLASDIQPTSKLRDDAKALHDDVDWTGGENALGDAQIVVASPGLKPGLEVFDRARRAGLPVISEVDLAFDASDCRWVAITGTDGKTTTTEMVGSMLEAADIEHVVAGNIGTALCDVVEDVSSQGVVVAEVSANQLWSCHHLAVDAAAITNIADDHLDYFDNFEEYPAAKFRLVRLQQEGADAVLPIEDRRIRRESGLTDGRRTTWFGAGPATVGDTERAIYFDDNGTGHWQIEDETGIWLPDFEATGLIGRHNQLNAGCAAAVARCMGASWEAAARGLEDFQLRPHRMERVGEVESVTYIDDSKATNVHASLAGIQGIDGPLVVIAGGRDKGLDLDEWARRVADSAEHTVVLGEITERMSLALEAEGGQVTVADTLPQAVEMAHKQARPGSTVVLSPACSSYDMFSSYKERGRCFQHAVAALDRD